MPKNHPHARKAFLLSVCLSALASTVLADSAPNLRDASVARISVEGIGACGAVLVGSDLVMTAAHCVVQPGETAPVDPEVVSLSFPSGSDAGVSAVVSDIATDPDFYYEGDPDRETIGRDVALLRLSEPVGASFESVVAPPRNLAYAGLVPVIDVGMALEPLVCPVRVEPGRVLVLDCARTPGTSGSPVFAMVDGKRRVVGTVSAGGTRDDGTPISFATEAAATFESLSWLRKDRGAIGTF